jgi:PAS domain S-box-containing protein
MNLIAGLDLISILLLLISVLWLLTGKRHSIPRDSKILVIGLQLSTLAYLCFMAVKWLGLSTRIEDFENMIGAIVPMMWAFVFYSFIQKRINQDIRMNEENLNITLNSIGDGVIVTDTRGRITRLNPVAAKLTGWKLNEALGSKLDEVFRIIHSSTKSKLKDPVGVVLETGKAVSVTEQPMLLARDKNEYYLSYSASPIFNVDNEITGVVLVFSDQTDKYLQSEKLRESEERLNLAIQGSRAGLWDWSIKTNKLICNEEWTRMVGYTIDELEPLTFRTWEKLTHPEDFIKTEEILSLYLHGKIDRFECEIRMKHKEGHWIWILDRGMVVERDASGTPLRMIGSHIDITRQKTSELELKAQMDENKILNEKYMLQNEALRKSLENIQQINEELHKAKQKAEESDRLKSAFLANMSHEIRTPMNGVIGFSEMLTDPDLDEASRMEYASIIIDSSRQLLSIVNDILDISRIEAGLVSLAREEVFVPELMTALHAFFEPQAKHKDLNFVFTRPSVREDIIVFTDRTRLRQILTNLINNALKFTQKGTIEMGFKKEEKDICFFVKDTGIGISEELHEKIFEPFRQVELEMAYHYGGTGLGLSISRKLVELLQGKIWLESTPGKGSVFYFTIPYQNVKASDTADRKKPDKKSLQAEGKVVLVAEDDDTNFMYIEAALSKEKINLIRAFNGAEAVEMVKNRPDIQLVLMDIKMPILNGYNATRQIKELRHELPVVMQTAYAMTEERGHAFEAGCDDYIAKPIRKSELIETVLKYIGHSAVDKA